MSSMHAFARDSSDESSDENDDFLHPAMDPNADDFTDYNPRKRRRTGRDAKESAALGIFGSESEDEGPGKRWKGKSNLRGKGINFVSSREKKDDEQEDEDEYNQDDQDDEEIGMEGASEDSDPSYLRLSAMGLDFATPAHGENFNGLERSNTGTPLGKGFVPSSAAVPILLQPLEGEASTPRIARPSAFSAPVSNGRNMTKKPAAGINAGSFAARMMAKMGYKEGEGLGKDGQGRSGAIEVILRPQGVGLGAVKEKSKQEIDQEKRQAQLKGEKYEGSDEEGWKNRRKRRTTGLESGSCNGISTPKKPQKPKYRTLQDMQRAAPGLQIPETFAPILDMTGPDQRLLTSTSGILTPNTEVQSLDQTESRKLARRAQNDLSAYVEEWKSLEERKAYVEMLIVQQEQEFEDEKLRFYKLQAFADTMNSISEPVKDLQWDPVIEALLAANEQAELSSVIANEALSSIAVAAVHPFLRQAAEGWQPLEDPKLSGISAQLFKIRHILGALTNDADSVTKQDYNVNNGSRWTQTRSSTAFESMMYKIIFPKIVSAINQRWDVHDPTALQTLIDSWEDLLPAFVRTQILDQAVVGKLNAAVSSWNPKKRRTHELPHIWLFPWLQYLSPHHADPRSSTGLVSDIKRKFRHLIDSWDYHKGIVPGLQQWRDILYSSSENDQWTPLIMNHVLPSMSKFLRCEKNFMVDPNDQAPYMSSLQGVFAWQEILKPSIVAQVLVETIFPMWHNVLHQWLTVVGPNEEIGQWFEWWRDQVFPDDIKRLKNIQEEFEKGHHMINQALDLGPKVATHLPAPLKPIHTLKTPPIAMKSLKPPVVAETTFRHRVEDWCIENDLQLLAEKKVLHSAGPLHRITAAGNGKNGVLVYFKGDAIWALSKKTTDHVDIKIDWESPDAKDALLGMAWYNVK